VFQEVPFSPLDLGLIQSRVDDSAANERVVQIGELYANHGRAYSVIDEDGQFLAAAGIHEPWAGVGEVWAVVSIWLNGEGLRFALACRRRMEKEAREMGLHRIQAHVRTDDYIALRFAAYMGLKEEGAPRPQYFSDKCDAQAFAVILR